MTKKKNETPTFEYEDRPSTLEIAKKVQDIWTNKKFAMITATTGVGKTFATLAAVGQNPNVNNALLIIFEPKAKTMDGSWPASVDAYNRAKGTSMSSVEFTFPSIYNNHASEIEEAIVKASAKQRAVILVVDEIHLIKNPTSKGGKALKKLIDDPRVTRTLGLSATAYSNSYLDAMGYLIYAGFYKNKTTFLKQHIDPINMDQFHQPRVKDEEGNINPNLFNEPELIESRLAEIVVDTDIDVSTLLPPAKIIKHWIRMDNSVTYTEPEFEEFEQPLVPRTRWGHYVQARNYYMRGYIKTAVSAIQIQRRIIDAEWERIKKMLFILWNVQHSNDPHSILIFYQNNLELELISNAIRKYMPELNIYEINGKHKEILHSPSETNAVMLIQYKAGGASIEFKQSYTSIFFMPTYSYQDYIQTLGRNRRAGMTHCIEYHIIMIENALDEQIWEEIIKAKGEFAQSSMQRVLQIQDRITHDPNTNFDESINDSVKNPFGNEN